MVQHEGAHASWQAPALVAAALAAEDEHGHVAEEHAESSQAEAAHGGDGHRQAGEEAPGEVHEDAYAHAE